jgi:hypothetical protein
VDVSLPWTEGNEPEWYHSSLCSLRIVESFVEKDLFSFFVMGTGYKDLIKSLSEGTKFLISRLKLERS